MGRNGCGKTTLIRCGLGLTRADFGTLLFEGERVTGGLPELSSHGVFFLPDSRLLSPRFTVREHLKALTQRFGPTVDVTAGATLEVESLMDAKRGQLSGGEVRRAEIWLACVRSPACLIADEPFYGIAPKDRQAVATSLRSLAAGGSTS